MDKADYLICRCEEVGRHEIDAAIRQGACTSQEIKMKTRAGMGTCQGRVCRSLLEALVSEEHCKIVEHPSSLTIHHPVRPIHIGQLIERDQT
ncbi:(2Fe-2S)-binding protein [Brevibacillus choshinensis]|uniref:(2Fe-2S)-binding protein n=1 Tax=Brevibacillus choshinensis TaxID=54911 RepID=UPI002E1B6B76|nr:(2Fe-2S)-binding protein [Brevibacillus choshinensis]